MGFATLVWAVALSISICYCLYQSAVRYLAYHTDLAYGIQHGCLPPNRLLNELPLGVDRLNEIFSADADGRLMALFLYHFRRWGDTLEQVFLGTKAFGTIDPRNLEAILFTQFNGRVKYSRGRDGIFTQDGVAWKHSRDLLKPQFARSYYRDLDLFKEHVDNLIAWIPQDGSPIDLQPLFFRFTLDTTTALLFGQSVYSLKSDASSDEKEFAEAFNLAQEYLMKRYRLLDLYFLIGGRKFVNACKKVHKFVDGIVARGLADLANTKQDQPDRYLFLDVVAQDSQDQYAVRDQLLNILLAGRDTTACLLSWTFRLLVRHPAVLTKLRDEIEAVMDGKAELTREELKKMTYLSNILKETLRLYPPVPVNTRVARRTTTLPTGGGPDGTSPVLVRRGQSVAYLVYGLHRQKHLYGEDAEDFRPERWDEGDLPLYRNKTDAHWGYLPFNGGPRVCLGRKSRASSSGWIGQGYLH
ncbi:MAG: hypothetical protein L6R39_002922 [Caloplaca ligustica]|nr:MAG: hypothetical protein L6R39_002922 [Caloplaca ligustica]